jgi:hypothetical protein
VPHEAHVVEERQPSDENVRGGGLEPLFARLLVREQVAVGEHDPLRRAGGARRVLDEGERAWPERGLRPRVARREGVGGEPGSFAKAWRKVEDHLAHPENGLGREDETRIAVGDDRFETRERSRKAHGIGRVGGHRDGPRVEASEEGYDVVEPRTVKKDDAVLRFSRGFEKRADVTVGALGIPARKALFYPGLEKRADVAGAAIELAEGEVCLVLIAVDEEREGNVVRTDASLRLKDLD